MDVERQQTGLASASVTFFNTSHHDAGLTDAIKIVKRFSQIIGLAIAYVH